VRRRFGVAVMAAVVSMSGCFVYTPVRPEDAVPATRVRATVSGSHATDLESVLGSSSSTLSGTLVGRVDEGLMVDVPLYSPNSAGSTSVLYNRVTVPYTELVALESRALSKWRTGVVVGAVVAGVVKGWTVLGGDGSLTDKQKTDTNNAVVPLFSFSLPVR